ncbi:unnamed protein product [Darwinula stevensoni]|uniref:Diphthine--ammonia ligase n=1 Tax=Darwinula stevensoni TaxID=69355 RepID=A0A7R8X7B9_9CRUS|nr:unnamed protein product [Darwinula stevensoni]CAG0886716.1 unnamed protein product [Darwinula stevensoni]
MKVVGLISGGKDSCYNLMQCVAAGHEIIALANLEPERQGEEDSWMYQTVGSEGVSLYADAMALPLYRGKLQGTGIQTTEHYTETTGDEVEDLYRLLLSVKEKEGGVEAVACGAILSNYQRVRVEDVCDRLGLKVLSYLWQRDQEALLEEMITSGLKAVIIKVACLVACGAILSNYQRVRVEDVCDRLGLKVLSYLWQRDQEALLEEMITSGLKAVIIKVACLGLSEEHLGKELSQVQPHLLRLKEKYGVNVCGEGGEYETFTLDCPLFKKSIRIDSHEVVMHSDDAFAPVAYLRLNHLSLEEKRTDIQTHLKVPRPDDFLDTLLQTSSSLKPKTANKDLDEQTIFQHSPKIGGTENFPIACVTSEFPIESALSAVRDHVKERGMEVVSVCMYIKDMSLYADWNDIYKTHFQIAPPARACVAVPLPRRLEGILTFTCCHQPSSHLHVQAISHWAPANIGPYSQAKIVEPVIHLSGQIGLVPGSMELVRGGAETQSKLALRHVSRVIEVLCHGKLCEPEPLDQVIWLPSLSTMLVVDEGTLTS